MYIQAKQLCLIVRTPHFLISSLQHQNHADALLECLSLKDSMINKDTATTSNNII